MERLTFEGNFCDIALCTNTRGGSFCEDGYCSQRKVWERLKYFEDLQEQGRLVELPCKVGDVVHVLFKTGIAQGTVENIYRCEQGTWWFKFSDLWIDTKFDDFGKNVFLTKAEAQAALERMEGKK